MNTTTIEDLVAKVEGLEIRPLRGDYSDPPQRVRDELLLMGLPEDYLSFNERFPLTSVFEKEVCFVPKEAPPGTRDGIDTLDVLFADCDLPTNNFCHLRQTYLDELPDNLFVIGKVMGGGLVCLDKDSDVGAVKLWDNLSPGELADNLYVIADSFSQFVMSLDASEVFQRESSPSPKILSSSISSDLDNRMQELLRKKGLKTGR